MTPKLILQNYIGAPPGVMKIIEEMVLNKLDNYREKANRDRFILPFDNDIKIFTNIIDQCVSFFN